MAQTITLRLKLRTPTRDKRERLQRQQAAYARACRHFTEESESLGTTSLGKVNRVCYQPATALFDLNTGVLQQAMRKAIAARRSVISRLANGKKAKEPTFNQVPVMYRNDLYKVVTIGEGFGLRFPTASGRSVRTFPVEVGEYQQRYLALLESGGARQGSGEVLQARSGNWYFHLTLVIPYEVQEPNEVLGVDLGVVKLATIATPDGRFTRFFDGRPVRWRRERRSEKRAHLQANGRLSRVKKMRGKETRWMTYHNHVISKQIVQEAKRRNAAIALEDLTGIRSRCKMGRRRNRMLASWAFRQLISFVEYKANLAEIPVIFVDPRNTSRSCSRCGHSDKGNRINQSEFLCRVCAYRSNADRNAAKNIALLGSMAPEHVSGANGSVTPRRAHGQTDLAQANPRSTCGNPQR